MIPALKNSVIVAAHPDDEILWMSSILTQVEEIIVCFSEYPPIPVLGEGRKRVFSQYPLRNLTSLDIRESGSYDLADWQSPQINSFGLELKGDSTVISQYRKNFQCLYDLLRPRLEGVEAVFTHNPWGEYGHEDHVQVHRAVRLLQEEMGFEIWFSNYFGERSLPLLKESLGTISGEIITYSTNKDLASEIMELYVKNRCWTWPQAYQWPDTESFFRANAGREDGPEAGRQDLALPMSLIAVELGPLSGVGRKSRFSERIKRMFRIE